MKISCSHMLVLIGFVLLAAQAEAFYGFGGSPFFDSRFRSPFPFRSAFPHRMSHSQELLRRQQAYEQMRYQQQLQALEQQRFQSQQEQQEHLLLQQQKDQERQHQEEHARYVAQQQQEERMRQLAEQEKRQRYLNYQEQRRQQYLEHVKQEQIRREQEQQRLQSLERLRREEAQKQEEIRRLQLEQIRLEQEMKAKSASATPSEPASRVNPSGRTERKRPAEDSSDKVVHGKFKKRVVVKNANREEADSYNTHQRQVDDDGLQWQAGGIWVGEEEVVSAGTVDDHVEALNLVQDFLMGN